MPRLAKKQKGEIALEDGRKKEEAVSETDNMPTSLAAGVVVNAASAGVVVTPDATAARGAGHVSGTCGTAVTPACKSPQKNKLHALELKMDQRAPACLKARVSASTPGAAKGGDQAKQTRVQSRGKRKPASEIKCQAGQGREERKTEAEAGAETGAETEAETGAETGAEKVEDQATARKIGQGVDLAGCAHEFLYVAPSTIPGAGLGLFSRKPLRRGARLGHYRGEVLEEYPPPLEVARRNNGAYFMGLTRRPPWIPRARWAKLAKPVLVDATSIHGFANCCKGDRRVWNCGVTDSGELVAETLIDADKEIFIWYGAQYWEHHL